MALLDSNSLREGSVFMENGDAYLVLKYSHMKKGRGQATIRVKVRNLNTGATGELTYSNEHKVELADIEKKSAQYLYADDTKVYFMDNTDYSQFETGIENIETEKPFMKDGQKVIVMFLDEIPISVEIPKVVELEVTDTTDAVAGNTSSGAMKDAVLETGLKIQVPLFIENGNILRVNTDSSSYVSRV